MKFYDPEAFRRKITAAQSRRSVALPGLTARDEANALIAGAVRNDALFENLHAGRSEPVLDDPAVSRITDAEMKQLMIRFSAMLAWLLDLRDRDPVEYARQIHFFREYTHAWDREGIGNERVDERGRSGLQPCRGR